MWLLVFCLSLSILSIMSLTFQPGICNKDVFVNSLGFESLT
jgi:hypothetical protein